MRFFDIVLFQDFLSLLSLQLYYFSISFLRLDGLFFRFRFMMCRNPDFHNGSCKFMEIREKGFMLNALNILK